MIGSYLDRLDKTLNAKTERPGVVLFTPGLRPNIGSCLSALGRLLLLYVLQILLPQPTRVGDDLLLIRGRSNRLLEHDHDRLAVGRVIIIDTFLGIGNVLSGHLPVVKLGSRLATTETNLVQIDLKRRATLATRLGLLNHEPLALVIRPTNMVIFGLRAVLGFESFHSNRTKNIVRSRDLLPVASLRANHAGVLGRRLDNKLALCRLSRLGRDADLLHYDITIDCGKAIEHDISGLGLPLLAGLGLFVLILVLAHLDFSFWVSHAGKNQDSLYSGNVNSRCKLFFRTRPQSYFRRSSVSYTTKSAAKTSISRPTTKRIISVFQQLRNASSSVVQGARKYYEGKTLWF